jgi:hypothetical protein
MNARRGAPARPHAEPTGVREPAAPQASFSTAHELDEHLASDLPSAARATKQHVPAETHADGSKDQRLA